jgi:hypothetical protein
VRIRPTRRCKTAKLNNRAAGAGGAAVDRRRLQLRQKQR